MALRVNMCLIYVLKEPEGQHEYTAPILKIMAGMLGGAGWPVISGRLEKEPFANKRSEDHADTLPAQANQQFRRKIVCQILVRIVGEALARLFDQ
jgi:hypothetical protein